MKYKTDKGVAGLTILLSLIVMLFVIGLVVMIFTLMSSSLSDATYDTATATLTNTLNAPTSSGVVLNGSTAYFQPTNCQLVSVRNGSASGTVIASGNYTLNGCTIANLTNTFPTTTYRWYINYTLSYSVANTGTTVINDTGTAIAGVTDWFEIFIVIGAMVVLILLTVIIITSIRGSGMIQSGGSVNQVGTA